MVDSWRGRLYGVWKMTRNCCWALFIVDQGYISCSCQPFCISSSAVALHVLSIHVPTHTSKPMHSLYGCICATAERKGSVEWHQHNEALTQVDFIWLKSQIILFDISIDLRKDLIPIQDCHTTEQSYTSLLDSSLSCPAVIQTTGNKMI